MGRFKMNQLSKGSLKDIQDLINCQPRMLTDEIRKKVKKNETEDIQWLSPLKCDDYAEYRDKTFIERVNIQGLKVPLEKFWPKNGPQWDGLGRSENGEVFLIEAKGNLSEIVSPSCGARSEISKTLINSSLEDTKKYIQSGKDVNWAGKYYQYTNRLAHLYYLRVLNNIDAYLVFVYFIGDKSVNGPKSKEEWLRSIEKMKNHLHIKNDHRLEDYIVDVFIDVRDIRCSSNISSQIIK